jgi:hypothetical protein
MDIKTFNTLLTRRLARTKEVLASKGIEYGRGGERLHNFKVAASLNSGSPTTPEKALLGMWRKHLVSVLDMIEDVSNGVKISRSYLDEKIQDTINYPILLEALIVESHLEPVASEIPFLQTGMEEVNTGDAKEVRP